MALTPPPASKQQVRPGSTAAGPATQSTDPYAANYVPGPTAAQQQDTDARSTIAADNAYVNPSKTAQPAFPIPKGTVKAGPENLPAGGIGGPTNTAAGAASDFEKNMPGYIENQVSGAQDTARANLASDIQGAKANANARGLLYSGQEAAGENNARANVGSQLASSIQGINKGALGTLATLQGNAVTEAQNEGANATQMAALEASASQTAYEQALQEQQAQDQYYSQMMGGALSTAGTIAGLVAKA